MDYLFENEAQINSYDHAMESIESIINTGFTRQQTDTGGLEQTG